MIREKTTIRMQNAVSKAEIFSEKWKDMATDERKQAMVEFIRSDEEQVERICDFLNELITPAQQNTLLSKFLEQGAEAELLDPIAIRWLELSATDVAKMSHWLKEANEFFLTKVLEGKVDPEHPMAPEDELEFRRRKAMLFAHLDDQKLRRILVARGLLTQDESLSAYLKRNAYDKDALIKYVPAFKRASDEDANQ